MYGQTNLRTDRLDGPTRQIVQPYSKIFMPSTTKVVEMSTFIHSFYVIFQSVHQPYFCNCRLAHKLFKIFSDSVVRVCSSHVMAFEFYWLCNARAVVFLRTAQANSELLEARLWAVTLSSSIREGAILTEFHHWFEKKVFEPGIWIICICIVYLLTAPFQM